MIYGLSLAWPQLQKGAKAKSSTAAFPKLFTFRERSRNSGFSCYNVTPLPKNYCSISLFTTGYKRLSEGLIEGFLMGDGLIGWWLPRGLPLNDVAGCC
jgi:hypothetical protein